ncbi:MAG: MBL fold metallo-hydrolase [SAR324 cluster bacterium]|nr:MBL fold metallo-hydrolase [SAR324 cluster bacterium]
MKIQFMGGAQTVTGSMHLIHVNGFQILLECGMFQGPREMSREINQNFEFDPADVDILVLSHAHLDHSGNIPNLVKKGFKGRIYATDATAELTQLMLKDSAFLQEMDVRWVNKIREKSGKPRVEPLYDKKDVAACEHLFSPVPYDEAFEPLDGVQITFREAGHILGSAGILLEINENGRQFRIGFTGDIGRADSAVLRDPNPVRDVDILITETTYGNRKHDPQLDIEQQLCDMLNEAGHKGSKILIPAFALGRTQQVVYYLHELFDQDRIPDIPIYVDSPLARKTTEIYRKYENYFDLKTTRTFLKDHEDPFGFNRLTYVEDAEESKALNNLVVPHVIISASGMCEGGRILHHLRNNIENPKCFILFVGYAAKHTLARRLMDGDKKVKIYGEEFTVKAKVIRLDGFSAHGDRKDILNYVKLTPPTKLKHIFLVHGEMESAESLVDAFRSQGYENIHIPERGQSYDF